jgi:hypothetical protein
VTCSLLGCASIFFRATFFETAVAEGEPAFRWTDFLIATEVEAAGSDRGRFIFLIMFRFVVCLLFLRLFRSEAQWILSVLLPENS